MTPTRALIDPEIVRERIAIWMAANGYSSDSQAIPAIKVHEMFCQLYAAISSAKATEEGVETTYDVEFLTSEDIWIVDQGYSSSEESQERVDELLYRWKCRIVEKRTHSAVIEVREKEGLHD